MRKKTLTIITRCGECGALFDGSGHSRAVLDLWDAFPLERKRFQDCQHGLRDAHGTRRITYVASDLAHPVPTPWFAYLYGAQS